MKDDVSHEDDAVTPDGLGMRRPLSEISGSTAHHAAAIINDKTQSGTMVSLACDQAKRYSLVQAEVHTIQHSMCVASHILVMSCDLDEDSLMRSF